MARGLQHIGTRKESYELQGISKGVLLTASAAAKLSPSEQLGKEEKLGPNEGLTNNKKLKESACNQPRLADGSNSDGAATEGPVPRAEFPLVYSFNLS
jgi:hypothetical protein